MATTVRTRVRFGFRKPRRFAGFFRLFFPFDDFLFLEFSRLRCGPAASFDFRRQSSRFCGFQKLRRWLRMRVHGLGRRVERQAAGHLRLAPGRFANAAAAIFGTCLQAAAIQHHRRRPTRRFPIGALQLGLAKLLHLVVADSGPLHADPFAQPLQMGRADLDIRQFPQVVTGLRERRCLARLANRLGKHERAITFRPQDQSYVQRKKKTIRHFLHSQRCRRT